MNYPKDFQMAWDIKSCRINNDSIEEIKGLPEGLYNPFDHYRNGEKELYLQFIAIDEDDPQSILKFISTYGFLGFKNDIERMHRQDLNLLADANERLLQVSEDAFTLFINMTAKNPEFAPIAIQSFLASPDFSKYEGLSLEEIHQLVPAKPLPPESENIKEIKQEILTMRALVSLWQALRANDREGVLSQLEHLNLLDYDNPSRVEINSIKGLEDAVLFYKAGGVLSRWVNQRLSGVSPLLGDMLYGNHSFTGLWYSPHLISAMYVMFYLDLTQGVTLRKCQNKTCKEFFSAYGGDERKIYCGDRCAKAHAQREYRQRKKELKMNEL
jgi:hypothetical protein